MNIKALWRRHAALYQILFAIAALLLARIIYTQTLMHVYLVWNLFLAWIPFALCRKMQHLEERSKWKQLGVLVVWLLFFPNALYIVTDLIHINDTAEMPIWYEALLLYAAATAGLYMGYSSLSNVEKYLQRQFGKVWARRLRIALLLLASYGVYLGRWSRWNSWDALHRPFALGKEMLGHVFIPWQHGEVWSTTLILALVYLALYRMFKKVAR